MDRTRTIGIAEMASNYGVSHRSLRFYEAKDLLRPQRVGTERRYDEKDTIRLQLILKGKQLGFSLEEVRRMILEKEAPAGGADADATARLSPREIEERLARLRVERRRIDEAIGELESALERLSVMV